MQLLGVNVRHHKVGGRMLLEEDCDGEEDRGRGRAYQKLRTKADPDLVTARSGGEFTLDLLGQEAHSTDEET